jgi:hypothetical protein
MKLTWFDRLLIKIAVVKAAAKGHSNATVPLLLDFERINLAGASVRAFSLIGHERLADRSAN